MSKLIRVSAFDRHFRFAGGAALICGSLLTSTLAATWQPQGPAPVVGGGNVDGLVNPTNPEDGAIQAILAHPADPNTLYVGAANGGVWKTVNGGASWLPLTDQQASLSIGGLAFDALDTNHLTIVVGLGRWSNSSEEGGPRSGILYSTNAGTNWIALGAAALTGYNLSAVAARGSVFMAAANKSDAGPGGLFRSVDGGQTFNLVGAAGTYTALVGDPSDPSVFYAAQTESGVYRTADKGATWTNVFSTPTNYVVPPFNMNLAVGANGDSVFVSIVASDQKDVQVYSSADRGSTWNIMDPPGSIENNTFYSPNPSGQGNNSSLAADPANPNLVYIGGDAQPIAGVSSGAPGYSGRLFRGDVSAAPGAQWTYLTGNYTTNASAPHADSRVMTFDAAGKLLEGDDGGIYARTAPGSTNGGWLSLIGNLQVTEVHSIAYDRLTKTLLAGNQDNGAAAQNAAGSLVWSEVVSGDGGKVAINNVTSTNFSVRYYSSQNLGGFTHEKFNSSNVSVDAQTVSLQAGGTNLASYAQSKGEQWPPAARADAISFFPIVTLNRIDPTRIAISTKRVYIGTDSVTGALSDTLVLTDLSTGNFTNETSAVAWGHRDNPDLLLVAATDALYLSTNSAAGSLALLSNYPGRPITDVIIHPDSAQTFFVADGTTVWRSTDSGNSWTDVGSALATQGLQQLHTLQFVTRAGTNALVVGGLGGLYASLIDVSSNVWSRIGDGLPNAIVWDSKYDPNDDLLVGGTLGRGAWTLASASAAIFGTGGGGTAAALQIAMTPGNAVQVTWQGGGHLEVAGSANGPWNPAGSTSGTYSSPVNATSAFFRVVNP